MLADLHTAVRQLDVIVDWMVRDHFVESILLEEHSCCSYTEITINSKLIVQVNVSSLFSSSRFLYKRSDMGITHRLYRPIIVTFLPFCDRMETLPSGDFDIFLVCGDLTWNVLKRGDVKFFLQIETIRGLNKSDFQEAHKKQ